MKIFSFNSGLVKKTSPLQNIYLKPWLPIGFLLIILFSSVMTEAQTCAVTGTGTATQVCTGSTNGTAIITLSGSGSGAPGTYTVDGGSPQSFSANPFTVTGLTAGNHTIVATVTAGPCTSSNIVINVPASTLPLPTIIPTATPAAICIGSSSTLAATGASTYTWSPGALSGSSVSVSPTTTTTYTVTGTNADGCSRSNTWAKVVASGYHTLAIKTDGTLWAWGYNLYGQLGDGTNTDKNIPVQIGTAHDWASISAGDFHSIAIKTNGTLWAWGYNASGQLGDGTIVDKNFPVQIGVATNWVSVSGGSSFNIGLKSDGTIWSWGSNMNGQIGDGTFTQRNSPVQTGSATNWASISAGSSHTLAIKTDGTLWSWGRNTFGALGDGTTNTKTSPAQVGTGTNWSKISGGFFHSLAVKTDGTLWAWGYNLYGQVGDGTTTQRNSPVQIGVATDWSNVDGGLYHSLGLKTTGTAWGWGMNNYGPLGDGTGIQRNSPVQTGSATNWSFISAGLYHSMALGSDGSLWGYGYNMMYGPLGDGTFINRFSPVQINTVPFGVAVTVNPLPAVSFSGLAGPYCITSGAVALTGSPAGGTFSGTGISGNTFNPATAGAGTYTITYSYTNANGCTNTATQSVTVNFTNILDYVNLQFPGTASFCQGGSLTVYGQVYEPGVTEAAGAGAGITAELGYSTTNSNPATWTNWQPATFNVQVGNNDEYMSTLSQLPAGTYYYTFRYTYTLNTCGYQYGGFSAGGGNPWDGVTYVSGVLTVNPYPTVTVSGTTTVCSGSSTVLTANGASSYTWQPGSLTGTSITVSPTTNTTYTVTGTSVAGCAGSNSWAIISAGGYHNLGIKTNGTLWASGQNTTGAIGDGTTSDRFNAVQIPGSWIAVSGGSFHSLGIKSDGTLWGWGQNTNGQIGDGTTVDKTSPVQIGTATNWVAVSAGGSHSLAMKSDGTLWGWGMNSYGQIGDGGFTQRTSPVQVGTETNWASFSAGGSHSLGIKKDGTLWAWGRGTSGQVGDGGVTDRYSPVQIGTGKNWKKIAACFFHSLAIKADGTLWAWGRNMEGQIGDGTLVQRNIPVQAGVATNWSNVEGGLNHSVALKTNGQLWGWGMNSYGELGNGTQMMANSTPVQSGTGTNWMLIDGGVYHTMAIRSDATLWAFGRNMEGQLGDGTSLTFQLTPEQIGTATASVTVTVNPLPAVSFSGLAANYCVSASAVTLTGSPAGGTFSGPGVSGNIFNPAVAGGGGPYNIIYTYTNPATGCSNSSTQTVTVNALPVVNFSGLSTAYCTTDPAVTLTGSPAGGTFSGPGISGNTFSPATAGAGGPYTITYTFTNANGCTNSVSQTTTVNALLAVSFTGLASSYCNNASPVTLTGSPAGGTFSGPGISGNTFNPAGAGVGGPYTITYIYTNANGCSNSSSQTVTVSALITVSFTGLAASYCVTAAAVTLTGSPSGGTFSGAGITNNGGGTASFNPATAGVGTYNITYAYSNGTCSNTASANVTILPTYTITASAGSNGSISPNGATAVCSGNSQPYTITANSGYHIVNVLVDGNSVGAVSAYTFTNVITVHTISASFAINCSVPSLSANINDVTCNGLANGIIDLVLTGGTAPFTYSWTGPGEFTASSEDLTGLAAGTYNVTVTATGGCSTTGSYTVNQPGPLVLACGGTNITCNGANDGTASVIVSGGSGPYTYSWTNGTGSNTGSVNIAPSKDNTIYAQSPTNSNGLGANIPIGADNSGGDLHRGLMAFDISRNIPAGVVINSATLNFNISRSSPGSGVQPLYLHKLNSNWGEGTSNAAQAGVGVPATASDATWAYRYYPTDLWSNAGGDFNASASAVANVNASGPYTWSSVGMVADVQQWLDNPSGNYGWLIRGAESGTQQGKRMDSKENTITSNRPSLVVHYTIPDILGTTDALSDLAPGSYTVVVTDANGCSATCTYIVTQPDPIVVTATAGTIACNSGTTSVTVSATGGSGNYTDGTGIFTNVSAGTYTYTVTDNNGCSGSTTITINDPAPLVVSFSGLAASYCTTDAAVTLTGNPVGGIFSGPGISGNIFSPATAGAGGPYSITYTYTNGNGCTNSSSQQVFVSGCGSTITLNLKLFLQGYYTGSSTMQPVLNNQAVPNSLATEADNITVELHHPATYALVDSKQVVLNTNGTATATFIQPAGPYYIAIIHRNSLQTWTANPIACVASTPVYDFSSAANMAMGDNQVEVEPGVWAFYTGDLNQDDFIDGNDFPVYDTESASGGLFDGTYTKTDMNGDGFVDGNDFPVFDGNSSNGVSAVHP